MELVLTLFWHWVNFGPLTRGSASTGYVAMHALLLAVGMPAGVLLGSLEGGVGGLAPPYGVQMDWEAILTPRPGAFVRAAWLAWAAPAVAVADRERRKRPRPPGRRRDPFGADDDEIGVITRAILADNDGKGMSEWTFRRMLQVMG